MNRTFILIDRTGTTVGQGYILPSDMVALYQENVSQCIYPSMDKFLKLQQSMGRLIVKGGKGEFYLQRDEDVTGISGKGIVARGCQFKSAVVMQWYSEYQSINWYKNIEDILKIHGHEGRTKLVNC